MSSQYATELVKDRVDTIVTYGEVAARAAQQATKTIPIVVVTDDMLGPGLVTSLARPTGNTTGVSILATELDGKRQELLIEAVPGLRRMAVLADTNTTSDAKLNALQEAARARDIELSIHRIAKGDEIASGVSVASKIAANNRKVLAFNKAERSQFLRETNRNGAQRVGVAASVRLSSAYYGSRRSAAPTGDLSMARKCGGGRFCRLRTERQGNRPRIGPTARQGLPWH